MTIAVPLLTILLVAATIDSVSKRIPNGLSLGGAVLGIVIQTVIIGFDGFVLGVLGWSVCLLVFLPFYIGGGMAAGDVKLMAAAGAFLGPINGFFAALLVMVAGAFLATLSLAMEAASTRLGLDRQGFCGEPTDELVGCESTRPVRASLKKIPYAGAIALGVTVAILQPPLLDPFFSIGG